MRTKQLSQLGLAELHPQGTALCRHTFPGQRQRTDRCPSFPGEQKAQGANRLQLCCPPCQRYLPKGQAEPYLESIKYTQNNLGAQGLVAGLQITSSGGALESIQM